MASILELLRTPLRGGSTLERLLPVLKHVKLCDLLSNPAQVASDNKVPSKDRRSLINLCNRIKKQAQSTDSDTQPKPGSRKASEKDEEGGEGQQPPQKRARGGEVRRLPESEWFKHLFGFEESTERVYDSSLLEAVYDANRNAELRAKKLGASYRVGRLELTPIKDIPRHPPRKGFVFNMILGDSGSDIRKVEVGAMQADPANKGATFQVASNFNCLEFVSCHDSAKRGVTGYIHDHTQGPAASISAGPATVYRNYFLQHGGSGGQGKKKEGAKPRYTGQLEEQVNLLDAVPQIPVVNGYIHFRSADEIDRLAVGGAFDFQNTDLAKVGRHTGVQVTFGLKNFGKVELCDDPEQVVNQVFTAAMNMADMPDAEPEHLVPIARWVLRAAYRGTILAAIDNAHRSALPARNKLFLTLIGGGVFGNKIEWIVDTIIGDCRELLLASGLEVNLVVFSASSLPGKARKRLEAFVKETKGRLL